MKSLALSDDLKRLLEESNGAPIAFGRLLDAAGERAFGLALLILALPSALPIPATGISTPLGIAIALLALQMLAGRHTLWVPERVQKMNIRHGIADKMLRGLTAVLKICERFLHPRWHFMHSMRGRRIYALQILLLSIVMQVPLPLTNTIPAAVIFVMALAMTEEDGLIGALTNILGVLVITTYIVGFSALLYFGFTSFDQLFVWLKA